MLGGAQLEGLTEWDAVQLEAAHLEIQIAARSDNAGNTERTGGQLLETADRAEKNNWSCAGNQLGDGISIQRADTIQL